MQLKLLTDTDIFRRLRRGQRQNGAAYGNYKIFPDRSGAAGISLSREMF